MALEKVSPGNHRGNSNEQNLIVRAHIFNKLVDDVAAIVPTPGTGEFDIINEETSGSGVTVDGVLIKDSQVTTNTINEKTAAAGVTADGVLLKDSKVTVANGTVADPSVIVGSGGNGFYQVSVLQVGASINDTLVGGFNSAGVFTDTIAEQTSTVGVTVDGALIKDGSFIGKQATATATSDGLTTGALTGADQFVTVTSASANDIICLPAEATTPIGTRIRGWVGANGFELRPIAAEAATTTINNVTTNVEAAIPATTKFLVEKVAANTWILTATDELGAVITAIIPDAV